MPRPCWSESSEDHNSVIHTARSEEVLSAALKTRIGGRQPKDTDASAAGEAKDNHYNNSKQAMEEVHRFWAFPSNIQRKAPDSLPTDSFDLKKALKATKATKQPKAGRSRVHDPEVQVKAMPSYQVAMAWMQQNTGGLTAKQKHLVQLHVDRTFREADDEFRHNLVTERPFLQLVHGPPGTGKSTVIKTIMCFFKDMLGWRMHREYTVGALQAVVAVQLGGETLHHLCGIPARRGRRQAPSQREHAQKVADKLSFLRYMVIDEVFMLSAKFLAEVEQAISRKVPDTNFFKRSAQGNPFSFGGVNVTLVGDMFQLDPPDNSFPLYTVPTNLLTEQHCTTAPSNPLVAHGLELLWGDSDQSVNGLIELEAPFRCKDPWWNEARPAPKILFAQLCKGRPLFFP